MGDASRARTTAPPCLPVAPVTRILREDMIKKELGSGQGMAFKGVQAMDSLKAIPPSYVSPDNAQMSNGQGLAGDFHR